MFGKAVSIFKFFLLKLNPNCDRLFQYPINSFNVVSDTWFANKPMGKNTLSHMMQRISEKSGLSQIYTCHSVRASCITLFQAGVEKIISLTRHKNTSSLKHYVSGMSSEQKEECSSILSTSVFGRDNGEIAIVSRYNENNKEIIDRPQIPPPPSSVVPQSSDVPSNHTNNPGSMMAKYSEIFGSCTFQNCEIKFS